MTRNHRVKSGDIVKIATRFANPATHPPYWTKSALLAFAKAAGADVAPGNVGGIAAALGVDLVNRRGRVRTVKMGYGTHIVALELVRLLNRLGEPVSEELLRVANKRSLSPCHDAPPSSPDDGTIGVQS